MVWLGISLPRSLFLYRGYYGSYLIALLLLTTYLFPCSRILFCMLGDGHMAANKRIG